ncbi:chaperone protein dnaJ 1, mitochondrial [Haematococcus lacustris]|uniref:Chaperone protein dnaJ 1, mitochondrial n=1 Tax=Haematococcus lacustris TaxID=44745 RepID=A0A699ZBW6_HAELA|nr:chaperone protein dnaJ 1, mitochondrial [Haematococcus lacustris]
MPCASVSPTCDDSEDADASSCTLLCRLDLWRFREPTVDWRGWVHCAQSAVLAVPFDVLILPPVQMWHPDRHRHTEDDEVAKRRFQRIQAAYEVLRDESRRGHYDLRLLDQLHVQYSMRMSMLGVVCRDCEWSLPICHNRRQEYSTLVSSLLDSLVLTAYGGLTIPCKYYRGAQPGTARATCRACAGLLNLMKQERCPVSNETRTLSRVVRRASSLSAASANHCVLAAKCMLGVSNITQQVTPAIGGTPMAREITSNSFLHG